MNKKICFISANPNFSGGISNYQANLIKYIKNKRIPLDITIIFKGKKDQTYFKDKVKYIEVSARQPYPLDEFYFNFKVLKILNNLEFSIINSHAVYGFWQKFYHKKNKELIVHTFHGVTFYFFQNHLKRFSFLKKILFSPLLAAGYLLEKYPYKKSDKTICVSNKVQKELTNLYGKRKNSTVIRTGVDLSLFKNKNKNESKEKLGLNKSHIHGLYVGRGGYWTKGLDRAVKLSEEIYKINNNYRLIVVGPDKNYESFINKEFIIFINNLSHEKISEYFSAADLFLCMSRYEGGAPTLVVSEAMASGCLLVCSEDSKQEIINDGQNGLIIRNQSKKEAERIISILNNVKIKKSILKNELKSIKELSIDKWGNEYYKLLN